MDNERDPSEDLPYRQLGEDGNPFDKGRPDFGSPEPAESQDGGRPDGDPNALVNGNVVPDEAALDPDADGADRTVAPSSGSGSPEADSGDAAGDAAADDDVDVEEVGELLPGGGRLNEGDDLDDKGLGAPLP